MLDCHSGEIRGVFDSSSRVAPSCRNEPYKTVNCNMKLQRVYIALSALIFTANVVAQDQPIAVETNLVTVNVSVTVGLFLS